MISHEPMFRIRADLAEGRDSRPRRRTWLNRIRALAREWREARCVRLDVH